MTFFGIYFPFCLEPKFITGFLKEAASTIPLDEFPSNSKELRNRLAYKLAPAFLIIKYLFLFLNFLGTQLLAYGLGQHLDK